MDHSMEHPKGSNRVVFGTYNLFGKILEKSIKNALDAANRRAWLV